jgi:Na+(H+)/acetate symporter ActP
VHEPSLVMFAVFVAITLIVTVWASGSTTTRKGFYTAHRRIGGIQNGWAITGDYLSAASFLGITGLIAFYGFDGFMYSVGWLVAYLAVLFLVAEPLRNAGKYTMADLISFRLRGRTVRALAGVSTLAITLFYMIAQMVGSGLIVSWLIPQVPEWLAIGVVGILMVIYVSFGGMLATTWVQIIKAGLLLITAAVLTVLVLSRFGFSLTHFLHAASAVHGSSGVTNLLAPGLYFSAGTRHGRSSAYPHAVLHRAVGESSAYVGRVGDGLGRCVLSGDVVYRIGRGHARRPTAYRSTNVRRTSHRVYRQALQRSAGAELAARPQRLHRPGPQQ